MQNEGTHIFSFLKPIQHLLDLLASKKNFSQEHSILSSCEMKYATDLKHTVHTTYNSIIKGTWLPSPECHRLSTHSRKEVQGLAKSHIVIIGYGCQDDRLHCTEELNHNTCAMQHSKEMFFVLQNKSIVFFGETIEETHASNKDQNAKKRYMWEPTSAGLQTIIITVIMLSPIVVRQSNKNPKNDILSTFVFCESPKSMDSGTRLFFCIILKRKIVKYVHINLK